MSNGKSHIPEKLRVWIEARKQFHLSHAEVQMARELGLNPKKFGKLANHKQEPWKMPLPLFIEHLYRKQFGRERPEAVMSLEEKGRRRSRHSVNPLSRVSLTHKRCPVKVERFPPQLMIAA